MANYTFIETSGSPACNVAVACSGRSLGGGTNASLAAATDGVPDLGLKAVTIPTNTNTAVVFASFACVVPTGVNRIDAQTITVNMRFSAQAGTGTPVITEAFCCRLNSGCTNQGSLGSVTGLSVTPTANATYSVDIPITTSQTIAPGDVLLFTLAGTNANTMTQWSASFAFNPETSIVISMSQVADAPVDFPGGKMLTLGLAHRK